MSLRFLRSPEEAAAIVARFKENPQSPRGISYATVCDYCDSMDHLPQITGIDGDLKNVQRPWAAKAIIANVPPPARLLEIGGGEPIASGFLAELGYEVTLVDPYDGFGNGPTNYQRYINEFPNVRIIRDYFRPGLFLDPGSFDAIFSISVLEHIPADALPSCFDAIGKFLAPGGASIHCFDFILQGPGDSHDLANAQRILAEQVRVTSDGDKRPLAELLERLRADVETFFLAPQGHHQWRGGRPYPDFPFRKVVSVQMVGRR